VRREHLGDLSVVSVRRLCDLCAKFFAFLQPSKKFMKNPGWRGFLTRTQDRERIANEPLTKASIILLDNCELIGYD